MLKINEMTKYGELTVTAKAVSEENETVLFTFDVVVDEEVDPFDRMDYLHTMARCAARLRNLTLVDIAAIEAIV